MASIVFRCDASPMLGAGHVMRGLAFAEVLSSFGWRATFAVNPDAERTVPALGKSDHRILVADDKHDPATFFDADTRAVVIDQYAYDATYERRCAYEGRCIVVFDDLKNRPHDCDFLVDPTPGRTEGDYASLVPSRCRLLLGPKYAMVHSNWRRQRSATTARLSRGLPVVRIVVSMGATDPIDATSRVLKAIACSEFEGHVDVFLGAGAPHIAAVAALTGDRVKLHVEPENLTGIVSDADLAIGAPGSSSFERAVIGLPAILIPTAANQNFVADAFERLGAALVLPTALLDDSVALASQINGLVNSANRRVKISAAAASLADGRGASRLLTTIVGTVSVGGKTVGLRLAEAADEHWLLDLQKQPTTRRYARNPGLPDIEGHRAWFAQTLDNPDRLLVVVTIEGNAAGMVRLDMLEPRTCEVSIAIDQSHRGKGIGRASLELLRGLAPGVDIVATIDPRNVASIAMFRSAGYEDVGAGRYRSSPAR